jgi:hypothetical protein
MNFTLKINLKFTISERKSKKNYERSRDRKLMKWKSVIIIKRELEDVRIKMLKNERIDPQVMLIIRDLRYYRENQTVKLIITNRIM